MKPDVPVTMVITIMGMTYFKKIWIPEMEEIIGKGLPPDHLYVVRSTGGVIYVHRYLKFAHLWCAEKELPWVQVARVKYTELDSSNNYIYYTDKADA